MKQITLISLLIISFIVVSQSAMPKSLGVLDNSKYKKVSANTAALILKRLGSKQSQKSLYRALRKNCVHFRFLGRKFYRKFALTKKVMKSQNKQRKFTVNLLKFVFKRLLSCSVVRKSTISYKIRSALKRVHHAKKKGIIMSHVMRLAKTFTKPKITLKKVKRIRFVKKFTKKTKKNKSKKLKKSVKNFKKIKSLKKKSVNAAKRCKRNGFKKNSASCKLAKKLNKTYRKKAKKINKVLTKKCGNFKKSCFSRIKFNCKKMFKYCKLAKKSTKSLRNSKGSHFARLLVSVINSIN